MSEVSTICSLFDHAAIGVSVCDPDGRYTTINSAYSSLTGYSQADLAGRDYRSITHPNDVEMNVQLARRMYAGQLQYCVYEKRYIRKDSRVVWVRNSVSLLSDCAGPLGAICLSEDLKAPRIAPHLHHELLCRTAQTMARLTTVLSRLESLASRDIQTREPLREVMHDVAECKQDMYDMTSLYDAGAAGTGPECGYPVPLSPREQQIVHLLAQGNSNKIVAGILNISVRTVETHRANIMDKLRLRSVADLVRYAIRSGISHA
ncbi:MAG: LuxR C-terminal-related transcriptional regulator [Bryobacteraceae bacterium]